MSENYLIGTVSALASVAASGATLAGSAGRPKIVIDGSTTAVPFWPGSVLFKVGDRVVVVQVGKELFALAARTTPVWQVVTLDSSVSATSGDAPRVTIVNGLVIWEGSIDIASGSWTTNATIIPVGGVPAPMRPSSASDSSRAIRPRSGSANPVAAYVNTTGSVIANFTGSASGTTGLNLSGLSGYVAAGYE